ncbi:pyridoxamine 5'-phosphate oxidase family protein [Paenibacillus sp. YYML68]|uniref:pyridoxamine 5'-phosphate oxidase family protein n=1 Tax=Paenibacillus sp. YYML68 TaxID=2909250 RepID=UPI002493005D|nr:pyridoxamine 5'-phosphate oxidase family protein [Paenibacillus sp. YYML68]
MLGSQGERELQRLYNTENRALSFYNNQMLTSLNPMMQQFIAEQEMVFVSTSDQAGNCDSTFRAGERGFVRVMNEETLIYPEYRGNGVFASLGNMHENPHIGLLFIDFFKHHIGLHVNGKAFVMTHDELASQPFIEDSLAEKLQAEENGRAERWVVVQIEEAYIHCSKHIPHFDKREKEIDWGTDDEVKKGGDFFKVRERQRVGR